MSKQSGRARVVGLPEWGRCAVMGVVNVTPDSFSDGGRWFDTTAAVKHGLALVAEGADLVDVGGESTRPGATRVDEAEELRRVIPVVRGLASEGVVVSVDTMRASVAEQALAAGAALVNDVSGGLADPAMIPVVADAGAPFVVMHWRGFLRGGNVQGVYDDVVAEVIDELRARVEAVLAGGVSPDRIVVDPGLGFSKDAEHDLALLARLDRLHALGHPLLVAASRKRFLGRVLAGPDASPPPARERDAATAAVSALAAQAGAWAVRVHEVRATADAVRVAQAIEGARANTRTPSTESERPARDLAAAPGASAEHRAQASPDAPGADLQRGAQSPAATPGAERAREAQVTSQAPGASTEPGAPESRHTPGTPSEPGTPEQPHTPGTPTKPRTPESRHTPGTPSEPGTPESRHTPGTPSEPGTPEQPHTPGANTDDRAPDTSRTPAPERARRVEGDR